MLELMAFGSGVWTEIRTLIRVRLVSVVDSTIGEPLADPKQCLPVPGEPPASQLDHQTNQALLRATGSGRHSPSDHHSSREIFYFLVRREPCNRSQRQSFRSAEKRAQKTQTPGNGRDGTAIELRLDRLRPNETRRNAFGIHGNSLRSPKIETAITAANKSSCFRRPHEVRP